MKGFKCVHEGFLKRTIPIGKKMQIKTQNEVINGKFFGLNEDGSLILECAREKIFVTAGDVTLIGN